MPLKESGGSAAKAVVATAKSRALSGGRISKTG